MKNRWRVFVENKVMGNNCNCYSHQYNCKGSWSWNRSGEDGLKVAENNSEVAMQMASSVCFAILAVNMCMGKRFSKRPETPEKMKLKSIWIEGVDKISENTTLPPTFDRTKEITVIIHGYLVDSSLPGIQDLVHGLGKKNYNVLMVDWATGTTEDYDQAASNVQTVGAYVYQVLKQNSIPLDKVYIIGQGLGAHAAAEVGKLSNGKIGRITGLDPSSPLFENTNFGINKDSAQFVDIIHTDARKFGYGMKKACGHLDIYVNGGRRQPGCIYNPTKPVSIPDLKKATFSKACGHLKAIGYYVESLSDKCKLRACECTFQKFLQSNCSWTNCVSWGYNATKEARGTFYGVTATSFPYCR